MSKGRCARAGICLLVILALSMAVRGLSHFLPSLTAEERSVYQDEAGTPYLTEMDSYFYLRFADDMQETGLTLTRWREADPLMGDRNLEKTTAGVPVFLSALTYALWRLLRLVFPVRLVQVASWMGPIFGSLAAVPAFLYARRRTNLTGGIAAGLLTGLAVPFVAHTHAGFFDTDLLLALLPLCAVLCQIRAMQTEPWRRQGLYALGCGGAFALLSLTWATYSTYFLLLALTGLLSALLILLWPARIPYARRGKALRGLGLSLAAVLLGVLAAHGMNGLRALLGVMDIFRAVSGSTDAFPGAFIYTSEMLSRPLLPRTLGLSALLRADNATVLGALGGALPCLLAAAALPLTGALALKSPSRSPERQEALLSLIPEIGILGLWLAAGMVLSRSSMRFGEIAVLPLCVLAGLGAGRLAALPGKRPWPLLLSLAALAAAIPMAIGAMRIAYRALPSATDAKAQAMDTLRQETPADTVIGGWWDDGYLMEYAARRRCISDGGGYDGPKCYFLGKALLAEDPRLTAGILRMLETANTRPLSLLTEAGLSQPEAANLLLRILPLSRQEATKALSLPEEQAAALLEMTHPAETHPLVLVLSSDLLAKLEAIAHYGQWDLTARAAQGTCYFMASAASLPLAPGQSCRLPMADAALTLTVEMGADGLAAAVLDKNGVAYKLSRFCQWRDGRLIQDTPLPGTGPAVHLVEENGRVSAFACSPDIAGSLLVRLLVCGDTGLPGVTPLGAWQGLSEDPSPAQQRITLSSPGAWCVQAWYIEEYLKEETP